MKKLGLYVHIPFCQKKCNYCDFYSLENQDEKIKSDYIKALSLQVEREAEQYREYTIDTIFFGGGTPSLISSHDIAYFLENIKKSLHVDENCEISIEINPKTVDKEKLLTYKQIGINRLSIGLQSTDDKMLSVLGRIHTYLDFLETYTLARNVGFDNISIDLMFGLPGQSKEEFLKTLLKAISLNTEHISVYLLKIEENTPFGKIKDSLSLPDDDTEYETYLEMCDLLSKNGYLQYEISNFSKEGKRSKHNLKYWLSEEYIGIGPNAHSYFENERYSYKPNVTEYMRAISDGKMPKKIPEENDTYLSKMDEYVMLKLRLSDGISINEFKSRFGVDFLKQYPNASKFLKTGHMENNGDSIFFTPKGFFVSNYILSNIFE